MSQVPVNRPLSEAELGALDRFLSRAGGAIVSVEMLDGFFAALVVGPELVLPSRYLPHLIGDPEDPDRPGFASMAEAQTILSQLTRHWNALAGTLARDEYWTLVVADDDEALPGYHWANGFLLGVDLTRAAWQPYIRDDQRAGPLIPIFMLAYENHPDAELRSPPITPKKRDELLLLVVAGLGRMYQDFREVPRPRRGSKKPVPVGRRKGLRR